MNLGPRSKVLVVGGSAAGISAADTLRVEGFTGEITVVGTEQHLAYARPPLSKAMLVGTETPESIALPALDADISVRRGTTAVALDLAAGLLSVDSDGARESLPFDGIVLATGSRARRLAERGQRGEHVLRTLDDAHRLASSFSCAKTVAILGGGFLGMELASSARALGLDVTVVDISPPLLRQLGPDLADLIVGRAREAGVRFLISPAGAELTGDREIGGIGLADGRLVEADVVITAVGDVPNVEWLAGSGLPADGPLEVGAGGFCRPGVVAAGDITGTRDLATGRLRRTPHWHSAISQGRSAARTLLHGAPQTQEFETAYFWTEGFGLDIKITGEIPSGIAPLVIEGSLPDRCAVLQWIVDGQPRAAASINHRLSLVRLKRLARIDPARTSEVTA